MIGVEIDVALERDACRQVASPDLWEMRDVSGDRIRFTVANLTGS
ncbi:hypothetical protein [Bryobacter aggregatus]|nr:hypothetical protein [Bryobacter aggregatus]